MCTYFFTDTKLGKKLRYFDHWVWAFAADGLFSSVPFGGSVGETGRYPNGIYRVMETQTWPHFTRFCAKPWNTRVSPVRQVEVPCLSNVTRMTVHLNSLLGGFAGVGTQGSGSLDRMGKCVCVYHGAWRGGMLAVLLAQTIGKKNVVRGMCLSKKLWEMQCRKELNHFRWLCKGLETPSTSPHPRTWMLPADRRLAGVQRLSLPSRFGPTPTLTK